MTTFDISRQLTSEMWQEHYQVWNASDKTGNNARAFNSDAV